MVNNRKNNVAPFLKSRYILYRKKAIFRKIDMRLKESEIIGQLQREIDRYAPLTIKSIEREVVLTAGFRVDALIEFCIADGPCFKALVEAKVIATPRIISDAVLQMREYLRKMDDTTIVSVIVVPYMGAEQAKTLLREGISWIDLCGNMMIKVEGKIYIERTGNKNLFPDTSPIKKIYEGTSSLVGRALLLKKYFISLGEFVDFINERGGNITLSTVSKVEKSLAEDLLVMYVSDKGLFSSNKEILLEKLAEGYRNYTQRNKNKTFTYSIENLNDLFSVFGERKIDYAICGFYAAKLKGLATTDRLSIFIKSINEARKVFERDLANIRPDSEYGQLDFIETKNPCVWFNLQGKPDYNVVDDIELYLEMMIDTPRGPKIAEILKERILKGQV
jgi:hypothetical protein